MTRTRIASALLAGALLAAACGGGGGSSSYGRDDFIADMTSSDDTITEEQAGCMYDGLVDADIDLEALAKGEDPSPEEEDAVFEIVFDCVDLGDVLGDVSVETSG